MSHVGLMTSTFAMPSAVKAEKEEVDTRSLLFGKEAPAHKFHATDDIGIDCLRLELSPCHLFCRGLENRRIGPVHVKLVCGMVHKGAEHAEKLAKAGLIPVLDAPFLQKDDVLQKTGLSNIGEIVAGQLLAELRLDKVRERIAELFVHRSGTDAFDELAVLDFLVVLEIIEAGLKQLRDGQHLRLFFLFLLAFGLETIGPLQYREIALLAFPLLGNGYVFTPPLMSGSGWFFSTYSLLEEVKFRDSLSQFLQAPVTSATRGMRL